MRTQRRKPGHSMMMAGRDWGCQRRAGARLGLISFPSRQAEWNRHVENGMRHAGGAEASFRVVALTPSYIGNVFAHAIPARLADDAKIGLARRERRTLTAPTAGRAVVA